MPAFNHPRRPKKRAGGSVPPERRGGLQLRLRADGVLAAEALRAGSALRGRAGLQMGQVRGVKFPALELLRGRSLLGVG